MEIPYYEQFISRTLLNRLVEQSRPFQGVEHLSEVGADIGSNRVGTLESTTSLTFLCELYDRIKGDLKAVLDQRTLDRYFIDQQTIANCRFNEASKIDFLDSGYQTVIGQKDAQGRVVVGPRSTKHSYFGAREGADPVADLPEFLRGYHVTLFGPPDNAKLCMNAMHAFYQKMQDEPPIIAEILSQARTTPKWGADFEDSKTPLREDMVRAAIYLTQCFEGTLTDVDLDSQKSDALEQGRLSVPIKRFPGLALPCYFLLYRGEPLPLHLYDFALHFFRNWNEPRALTFYVPKLENEEEARYLRIMFGTAERLIRKFHPQYKMGSIRALIVLENPRAIFRAHEIMDELYPYFAGASLGWHDFLASTARLFKEDPNYRIPKKSDPNIVIKYIQASHELLAATVGSRGGVQIGGMYGVLPISTDRQSPSFQVALKGFIKDVAIQMKRKLSGFWVAHPDFVRIGLALVESWSEYEKGTSSRFKEIVRSLLNEENSKEVLDFISGPDSPGLDQADALYPRSLIVADFKPPEPELTSRSLDEVRFNVFQTLQYLADWLAGNGCVALPTQVQGIPVRVMDDLATAERSRWEVWHELYHNRLSIQDFLKIAQEEFDFIRQGLSISKRTVQVKWDERTEKWYPISFKLMVLLMTRRKPPEFATELLLPFTIEFIRNHSDPWSILQKIDSEKYAIDPIFA